MKSRITIHASRIVLALAFVACLAGGVSAQTPPNCTITGVVRRLTPAGPVVAAGVKLHIIPIDANGTLVSTLDFYATADVNGVVSFTLIQGIQVQIKGPVLKFADGLTVTVPSTSTANLDDLPPATTFPATGVLLKNQGTPLPSLVSSINLAGAGVVTTQPSGGAALITINGGITSMTGDVTGSGVGSVATTLATVNSNVGSFGGSTAIPVITVDAKGRITAVSTAAISATPFSDSSALVKNNTDPTKLLILDASLLSTGTTRTLQAPDRNGKIITDADSGTVTNGMLAGGIGYSKLALTGTVLNADVSASAAIAYSKLNLTGAILNADLAGSIANAKLVNSSLTVNGTTNQINGGGSVSLGGALTLSLPQNIHTGAAPQFASLGLGVTAPSTGLKTNGTMWIDGGAVNVTGGGTGDFLKIDNWSVYGTPESLRIYGQTSFGYPFRIETDGITVSGNLQASVMTAGYLNAFYSFQLGVSGDLNLSRISASLMGLGSGADGSFGGSLKLTNLTAVGSVYLPDGTTANPSLRFSSQTNSGLIYAGGNQISVVSAGAAVATFANAAGSRLTFGGSGRLAFIDDASTIAWSSGSIGINTIGVMEFNRGTMGTNIGALISSVASGVNYLNISSAIAGAAPSIIAQGSDTNIGVRINGKGSMGVGIQKAPTSTFDLEVGAPSGNGVRFDGPLFFQDFAVGVVRAAGSVLQLWGNGVHVGVADAVSPVAQTLSVQSVVAGTSNTAGTDFTISGSQSTGNAAGGSIIFKTSPAGSSGTSVNALSAAMTINSLGQVSVVAPSLSGPMLTLTESASSQWIRFEPRGSSGVGGQGTQIRTSTTSLNILTNNGNVGGQLRLLGALVLNDATDAGDTVIDRVAAANIRFGGAAIASPIAQTLSVQNVVAGTSNTAGADFTISGSQGTGTGAGGNILFKIAPAGSAGTSVNSLVTALSLSAVASGATGLNIQSNASGSGVTLTALSSASSEGITIASKGPSANVIINSGSGIGVVRLTGSSAAIEVGTQNGAYAQVMTGLGLGLRADPTLYDFSKVNFGASGRVVWNSGTNWYEGSTDSGLSRISAGLIGVGTGSAGSFAGSLKLTNLTADGQLTFSNAGTTAIDFGASYGIISRPAGSQISIASQDLVSFITVGNMQGGPSGAGGIWIGSPIHSGYLTDLIITSGGTYTNSQTAGNLRLRGGENFAGGTNSNAGNVYVYGGAGSGSGTSGNVYLGTDGTTARGQVIFPNVNSSSNPPFSIGSTNTGLKARTSTLITMVGNGTDIAGWGSGVFTMAQNAPIQWASAADPWAGGWSGIVGASKGVVAFTEPNGSTGGTMSSAAQTPAQITSDQNNYAPGGPSMFQRWSSDASRNVTGLSFGVASVSGQTHYLWNAGSQNIVLINESASSTAANRFTTTTGTDITITANRVALVMYDATSSRWRAVLLP